MSENITRKVYAPISKKKRIKLLETRGIINEEDIKILKLIYFSSNYRANPTRISETLNYNSFQEVNNEIARMGHRIADKFKMKEPKWKTSNNHNWWHIVFLDIKENGIFYWILRQELKEAMDLTYAIKEKQLYLQDLYNQRKERLSKCNIYISLEKFLEYYK